MIRGTNRFIAGLLQHPRKILLLDGIGAGLTLFFLMAVLATFEPYFGVPPFVLHMLVVAGAICALYSGGCYFFVSEIHPAHFRGIIALNVAYCLLTIGLIAYIRHRITALGFAYFSLELVVVLAVILLEREALLRMTKQ